MSQLLRNLSFVFLAANLAVSCFAQTPAAKEKYYKALKQLDWDMGLIGGNGPAGIVYRHRTPPNPQKAEKLFNEAATLDPNWVMPQYGLGDLNFVLKKFSAAAVSYAKARDVDDKGHQLEKVQRRDLLDQLGLSYALDAEYKEATAVYTAAIKEDPEFPLFHYNLACVHAESHNLPDALDELKLAWQYKDNMPKGQPFPDPRQDSSWREYLDNPRFQEVVRDMVI